MIEFTNVTKTYKSKKAGDTVALNNISFKIPSKGLTFLTGESGCGKSTLLNVLGGLDNIDSGIIKVEDKVLNELNAKELEQYRNSGVGFIFQDYNLFEQYNVYDNVLLALELREENNNGKVDKILKKVGLEELKYRKINELSGGQKQRVAIARALVKKPKIILADEPTGNLDYATSIQIFELLKEIAKDNCVIVVTHDREAAVKYGNQVIALRDGQVVYNSTSLETYEGTALKLENSHFKNKYALKFMLSNIKLKPFKFILTVILTAFALNLVALSFTAVLHNDAKFNAQTLLAKNVHNVGIKKSSCYSLEEEFTDCIETFMDNDDVAKIESEVKQTLSKGYIISNGGFSYGEVDSNGRNDYFGSGSHTELVFEVKDDKLLKLFMGRLPSNKNEAVIGKYLADKMMYYGVTDKDDNLFKPSGYEEILNKTLKYGNKELTIVGINDFDDSLFTDLKKGLKVDNKILSEFNAYEDISYIYVKGFIEDNDFTIDNDTLLMRSYVENVNELNFYNGEEYLDLNGNISNKDLEFGEFVVSLTDFVNLNTRIKEAFQEYYQQQDMSYEDAMKEFYLDYTSKYKDAIQVELHSFYLKNSYESRTMSVAGVSLSKSSYISPKMVEAYDTTGYSVRELMVHADNYSDLFDLTKKFSFPTNVKDVGFKYTLSSNFKDVIGYVNMMYYMLHKYLLVITLVVVIFAIILIYNFVSVTISYSKKTIGILRSLGIKLMDVLKIYTFEAILIAVVSYLLSIVMWIESCKFLNNMFFSDYYNFVGIPTDVMASLLSLGFVIAISIAMNILACTKVARVKPIDALLDK